MKNYERVISELENGNTPSMKVFGNSMMPIIKSGSIITYQKVDEYNIGDIVLCKIKSRFILAHKIIKKDKIKGYLISNNLGFENGWTNKIYGKAIKIEFGSDVRII